MTDRLPSVGDSAEHIAFRLFEMIVEKDPPKPPLSMNATWILSTYQRCLRAVRNPDGPARSEASKVQTN